MSRFTAHFIDGPFHGMDKAVEDDRPRIKVATWPADWNLVGCCPEHAPICARYGEVEYELVAKRPAGIARDGVLDFQVQLIYAALPPKQVNVSPEERIARAQKELTEARAELDRQSRNRTRADWVRCPNCRSGERWRRNWVAGGTQRCKNSWHDA